MESGRAQQVTPLFNLRFATHTQTSPRLRLPQLCGIFVPTPPQALAQRVNIVNDNNDIYNKLRPILSKPIPNDLEALKAFLDNLRSARLELAKSRSEALRTLQETRPTRLRPKDREWTDLDRKTEMDAFCAEKEQAVNFLNDLWEICQETTKTAETAYRELCR